MVLWIFIIASFFMFLRSMNPFPTSKTFCISWTGASIHNITHMFNCSCCCHCDDFAQHRLQHQRLGKASTGKLLLWKHLIRCEHKQLREIYESINMKYLTQDERLDALLTLKQTVKVGIIRLFL